MHWNHWRSGAVAAVFLSASPVFAQGCAETILDKVNPDQNAQAAFVALAECIVAQQKKIIELEGKLATMDPTNVVPAVGDHEGTKAIVAFTSEKGEKTCPVGWVPFEAAKDRFILGAGGKYPVVGRTGGEEVMEIGIEQLPHHAHTLPGFRLASEENPDFDGLASGPHFGDGAQKLGRVWVGGAPKPTEQGTSASGEKNIKIDNMPPYIPLYFCMKS